MVLSRLGSARHFIRRDSDEVFEGVRSGAWAKDLHVWYGRYLDCCCCRVVMLSR